MMIIKRKRLAVHGTYALTSLEVKVSEAPMEPLKPAPLACFI